MDISQITFYDLSRLYYGESSILSYGVFSIVYKETIIYHNSKIEHKLLGFAESYDISKYLDITKEDALKIYNSNESYIEKYFKKFMTKEDTNINDAYDRIYNELTNYSNTEKLVTTTTTE